MIEVSQLTKSYGTRLAIDQLNFSVKKGEVVGFLGPNGAGKSTTMKIITGHMAPSEGVARIAGFDVFENPLEVKRRVGYLPETPPVYGEMYVQDYLEYVALLKDCEKSEISKLVQLAIEKTQLGDVRSRLIQNLSKGFRQRVGIAQALVSNPDILILDEPTVGLDPKQVAEIRKVIQELRGSHTIILSTHILPEVQATCERIIIINEGRIVAQDTLEGLSHKMKRGQTLHLKVQDPEGVIELVSQISGLEVLSHKGTEFQLGLHGGEKEIIALTKALCLSDKGLLQLSPLNYELEDIFIQLTSINGGAIQ